MRGAHHLRIPDIDRIGIIPADAGSTADAATAAASAADHPRGCGEHLAGIKPCLICTGSSPRMRGALRLSTDGLMMNRDHPRGCGEHTARITPSSSSAGSSPRMRGAPSSLPHRRRRGRIIPADAGSTPQTAKTRNPSMDHPRGCGEHLTSTAVPTPGTGSSPRMRGARSHEGPQYGCVRIIPADAGSTRRPSSTAGSAKDHPRGCGEHGPM